MDSGLKNVERYKLLACLKKAGRVETWKAIDPSLRRYVIIKLMHAAPVDDPGFLARFTRDTKALSGLNHPHIVRIQNTRAAFPPELAGPIGYIVMDYIDGVTLADEFQRVVHTGRGLSVEGVVYLIKAIADAVDFAQQRGIVHGNIQPANILLRKHSALNLGEPVLTCFGTAKLLGTTPGVLCLWGGDMPHYLSPEQCQGKAASLKSDVYALGAMLYELYTGVPPFQGESVSEVMVQHMYAMPTPPILINRAMPPAVSKLIMCCLEKTPELRFATASALASALADALLPFKAEFPVMLAAARLNSTPLSLTTAASSYGQHASARYPMYAPRPTSARALATPKLVPITAPLRGERPASWRAADSRCAQAGPGTADLPARTEELEAFKVFT